ncbi:hypothetical protein INT43_008691 [Umbelopsis isabellina]|uniref:UBC core domain-containing protein n=1 Tax=Mortierella isabellina TaxID=91625 RepID=A0A8H7PV34_MORIS|nr:hypothetical protein INT43_008691 [Umbelopsis isabellina]
MRQLTKERCVLKFHFTPSYPLEAPEVLFLKPYIPIHPQDWSPVQTVAQVCLSIQSMLSSCTKKELPPDNDLYVRNANTSPKKTAWAFQ